jgi:hypothetical protein
MAESVVTVSYADSSFSGLWRIAQDILHVESAYGEAWTPLGLRMSDPSRLAERVLTDLVSEWLTGNGSALH